MNKSIAICIAKFAMYCLKFHRRLSKLHRILQCDTGEIGNCFDIFKPITALADQFLNIVLLRYYRDIVHP